MARRQSNPVPLPVPSSVAIQEPSAEVMKQQNPAFCRVLMVTGGVVMTPKIGPVGLEPTTYGLEIRCSVQLSYEPKTPHRGPTTSQTS